MWDTAEMKEVGHCRVGWDTAERGVRHCRERVGTHCRERVGTQCRERGETAERELGHCRERGETAERGARLQREGLETMGTLVKRKVTRKYDSSFMGINGFERKGLFTSKLGHFNQ